MQQKATSLQGEPWYREVVELRRQANDYKVQQMIYGHLSFEAENGLHEVTKGSLDNGVHGAMAS